MYFCAMNLLNRMALTKSVVKLSFLSFSAFAMWSASALGASSSRFFRSEDEEKLFVAISAHLHQSLRHGRCAYVSRRREQVYLTDLKTYFRKMQ